MRIGSEKYVSTSTFRRSGAAVHTPTWIVELDGDRVGFWTSSASGKFKRLKQNHVVKLQPCDQRGRVRQGALELTGVATLVTSGPEFDAIQAKVRAKYGAMVPISRTFNRIGHLGKKYPYGDVGVVVTLAPPVIP